MARKKKSQPSNKEIIREHYRKIGKKGGKARAEKLTPERRKEIAQIAHKASRRKKPPED